MSIWCTCVTNGSKISDGPERRAAQGSAVRSNAAPARSRARPCALPPLRRVASCMSHLDIYVALHMGQKDWTAPTSRTRRCPTVAPQWHRWPCRCPLGREARRQIRPEGAPLALWAMPVRAGSSPRWRMSGNRHRFVPDTRFCTDVGSAVSPSTACR